jgi:hypothetical protein
MFLSPRQRQILLLHGTSPHEHWRACSTIPETAAWLRPRAANKPSIPGTRSAFGAIG